MTETRGKIPWWAVPAGLTLLGLLLRLSRPMGTPLWYDEASSWDASTKSWWTLLTWRAHFEHPPLSFALVKLSTGLLGTRAEWALRLPSLVAGVLCVPAAYWAGRRATGRTIGGVVLGLLLAGDFTHVLQSANARMYTLLALSALLAFGLVAGTEEQANKTAVRRGLWLGGALLLGVWSSHLAWLLVVSAVAAEATRAVARPRLRRASLTAAGVALVLTAVCASPGLMKLADRASGEDRSAEIDYKVRQGVPRVIAGRVWGDMAVGLFAKDKGVSLALFVLGTLGIAVSARQRPAAAAMSAALLLLTAAVVPVALRWHHSVAGRYLILAQLAAFGGVAALASAAAADPPWRRAPAALATLLAVVLAGWGGMMAARATVEPMHGVGALLKEHAAEIANEPLICHRPMLEKMARYYGVPRAIVLPDAPPPDAAGTVWIFAGHLRLDLVGQGPDPVVAYLAAAAAARGHPVDADVVRAEMMHAPATLWRVDAAGVTKWVGRCDAAGLLRRRGS